MTFSGPLFDAERKIKSGGIAIKNSPIGMWNDPNVKIFAKERKRSSLSGERSGAAMFG